MGKCCLRFRSLGELDLDVVAEVIRRAPTRKYVERYFSIVGPRGWASKVTRKVTKKVTKKAASKT